MTDDVAESGTAPPDQYAADARVDPDAPVGGRPHDRQWDLLAAISLGGIIGAEARLAVSDLMPHGRAGFPWATIVINVVGCLLIGVLMTTLSELTSPHRLVRPFLGVGILGGFTTFSTFAVDAERLLQDHRPGMALSYVVCTLLGAAAAVPLGIALTRALAGRTRSRTP